MVEQIKRMNDIGQVIGRYVTLTRRGNKSMGLCPFHEDHHPSLQVHPGRQRFICYACGAKGDVISFIQQIEKCTFQEALEKLSPSLPGRDRILNPVTHTRRITNPADRNSLNPPQGRKPERDPFFSPPSGGIEGGSPPLDHTPVLQLLMPYCSGERELTPFYLDFEVGIAPHTLPPLWKALAGRIIFPIRDKEGVLVGFSGRKTEQAPEHLPKYLNTASADGYRRNEHLYGLYKARKSIRSSGRIYLTEGAKDTIAMHAAGFTNCVGLCGKDLSARQQQLILEWTNCVCVVMDGDPAGKEGAGRMISQLQQAGAETVQIYLPDGEDPDSLFRKYGKKAFREFIMEQAFPPSRTEVELIAGCLVLREATIQADGASCLFNEWLPGILQRNRIRLRSAVHREILHMLSKQKPMEEWKEEIRTLSLQLIEQEITNTKTPGPGKFAIHPDGKTPYDPEAAGREMKRRLLRYAETRLSQQLKDLFNQLGEAADPEAVTGLTQRTDLLIACMERQELLAKISLCLQRPGAIHEQWIL